jgi:hypothetical protein
VSQPHPADRSHQDRNQTASDGPSDDIPSLDRAGHEHGNGTPLAERHAPSWLARPPASCRSGGAEKRPSKAEVSSGCATSCSPRGTLPNPRLVLGVDDFRHRGRMAPLDARSLARGTTSATQRACTTDLVRNRSATAGGAGTVRAFRAEQVYTSDRQEARRESKAGTPGCRQSAGRDDEAPYCVGYCSARGTLCCSLRAGSPPGSASHAQSDRFQSGMGVSTSVCGTNRDRSMSAMRWM